MNELQQGIALILLGVVALSFVVVWILQLTGVKDEL